MHKMKKCELLVPAGGEKQFIAAVENGADAVYVGGHLYNARMGAGNFTTDEIGKAADYAHLRNVKIYVTMNTLMEEDELNAGTGLAEILYEKGVDGLIIQDLGLAKCIRERMPDFPLHLSTQATVYNRRGLEAAVKLGFERAVLARELSLDKIRECSRPRIMETEVFVHGALCMCYSGQCQMSRYIGGRSGNKGRCAQPCRLPYTFNGKEGYPLSPKDLCMIDRLGDLIDAGVASLKIEGRMKSAEYVATVTRIYRKYIDRYYDCGSYTVSYEDREELLQIFNRGGFTEGYAEGDPGDKLMSGLLPKNQGVEVGFIRSGAKDGILADIELAGQLEMGDVVEIHGRELSSTKVTYLERTGRNTMRIGDMKGKVNPGDKVYRIISSGQMKRAQSTFESLTLDGPASANGRKTPVDMVFKSFCGLPAELTVSCSGPDGEKICAKTICEDVIAQKAVNRATTDEEIKTQLIKTGNTVFYPERIKIIHDGQTFMPVSGLNKLRRKALEELTENKKNFYKREMKEARLQKAERTPQCAGSEEIGVEFWFYSIEEFLQINLEGLIEKALDMGVDKDSIRVLLPLRGIAQNILPLLLLEEDVRQIIIPYIPNVTAGPYDDWLESNLSAAAELVKNFGGKVYVGNISWIEAFASEGVQVRGDYGLNITNSQAEAAYRSLGMQGKGQYSLEKNSKGMGSVPLMIIEHKMAQGYITDRKGAVYRVDFDKENHKTAIRPKDGNLDWEAIKELLEKTKRTIRIYV